MTLGKAPVSNMSINSISGIHVILEEEYQEEIDEQIYRETKSPVTIKKLGWKSSWNKREETMDKEKDWDCKWR
jgi:hypothetical protein